jgi:hypothetical protein
VWKAVSFQLSSDEPPAHEQGAEDEGGGGAKDQPADEGGRFLDSSPSVINSGKATSTYLGVPISGLCGGPKRVVGATSRKV